MIKNSTLLIFVFVFSFSLAFGQNPYPYQGVDSGPLNQETGKSLAEKNDPLLFESFEDEGVFPPAGWTYVNGVPEAYWEQNDYYSYDGEHSARAYQGYQSDYKADEWLITPAIDFDDPKAQWLTFFGFTHSDPDGVREKMHIMAVDQAYDNVEDLHNNATLLDVVSFGYPWAEFIVDLSQLSGQKHLAFVYLIKEEDETSFAWLYLDKVQVSDFTIHTLTMETPDGEGSVDPVPGNHQYVKGRTVVIQATPEYGWDFSHWDGDVHEPYNMNTTMVMDQDKTIKAHFVPLEPIPIPFFEDFSGVANTEIPVGWTRTHRNWGVWPTTNAGGARPEMRFHWNPSSDDNLFRLTSRPVNASQASGLVLEFKHFVNDFLGNYILKVQSSTDTITWNDEWTHFMKSAAKDGEKPLSRENGKDFGPEEVTVNLDHLAGEEEFYIAFVFEGDNSRINSWFIDDVFIGDDQPYYTVNFQVENSLDGEPLAGVLISIDETGAQSHTNNQGHASFELPSGSYTASLSKDEFIDKEKSFQVADEDLTVEVAMEPVDYSHNVIFNVNMKDAVFGDEDIAFDPASGHEVFIAGSFEGEWITPGEDTDYRLSPRTENPDIYTITLKLLDGDYEYKYFVVVDGQPGWDYGEWDGEPNREIQVTGPVVMSDVWGDQPVGTDEVSLSEIRIFPNPAKDNFVIRSSEKILQLQIVDLQGRVFRNTAENSRELHINISGMPSGLYLLRVKTEKGSETHRIQIIQ